MLGGGYFGAGYFGAGYFGTLAYSDGPVVEYVHILYIRTDLTSEETF